MTSATSPPKTFELPIYAQEVASVLATTISPKVVPKKPMFDSRVLQFLDVEALGSSSNASCGESSEMAL